MRRNTLLFLANNELDNVEDEKEYNQFDEVPFLVDTTIINIVETKISYSMCFPTRALMVQENLFMYSSSLHIFNVLLQCNMHITLLNHYLMHVAETINYPYLLFQLIIFFYLITFILINLWDNIIFSI
jgi:hypothetical protein